MRRGGFLDLTVTFEGIGQSKITKSMMNINLLNNWQLFASQIVILRDIYQLLVHVLV